MKRVSARIDDELARELSALKKRSGRTLSAMVGEALRAWARAQGGRSPAEIFAATGFIGSGAGARDLARNSKKYLAEA